MIVAPFEQSAAEIIVSEVILRRPQVAGRFLPFVAALPWI